MYLAYSLLLTLGFLVLLPRFIFDVLTHGKYVAGLRQRLGSVSPVAENNRPAIWMHCVSVGETQAARPLVARLRNEFPEYSLVISTTTLTGQTLAREAFKDSADFIFYFPFDWLWTVRRTLARVKPVAVLIMETELWPNFLRECKAQQIPVALVNGRISRQSFRRYRLIKLFFRRVLSCVDLAVMQTEGDAERIRALGFPNQNLFVSGNIKFDVGQLPGTAAITAGLEARFGLSAGTAPLILAASTHAPEEKIVLDSFRQLRTSQPGLRLLLAPRHPERFREVASLLDNSGLTWSQRTASPKESDLISDVILLDTIGELPAAYPLATIVFVGGSLVKKGGHNVLEPAATGACVVTGAYTHNFEVIVQLLKEYHAIVQLPPLDGIDASRRLVEIFGNLLLKQDLRKELGDRAKEIVTRNEGAADRTLELISPLLLSRALASTRERVVLAQNVGSS